MTCFGSNAMPRKVSGNINEEEMFVGAAAYHVERLCLHVFGIEATNRLGVNIECHRDF
jgi:hypothetical protein